MDLKDERRENWGKLNKFILCRHKGSNKYSIIPNINTITCTFLFFLFFPFLIPGYPVWNKAFSTQQNIPYAQVSSHN